MKIGSLFSGIGGLELGLERAGVGHTVWQVEQDEYCRAVLAKHWPDAKRYDDVRTVGAHSLAPVDVICGGFPCQDISDAGNREGIGGDESGLWVEFARILRELRPRYAVVENVTALTYRGLGRVLGDLADLRYDATWDTVPAGILGAPHIRSRTFILGALSDAPQNRLHSIPAIRQGWTVGQDAHARGSREGSWWVPERGVEVVADGLPRSLAAHRALGNAVVPQVAEVVGRVLLQIHEEINGAA